MNAQVIDLFLRAIESPVFRQRLVEARPAIAKFVPISAILTILRTLAPLIVGILNLLTEEVDKQPANQFAQVPTDPDAVRIVASVK